MTMNSISTAMELFSYTGVSISLLTIEQTLVLTKELSRIMSTVIVNTAISIKPKVEAISITPNVEHFTYCSTSHDVS